MKTFPESDTAIFNLIFSVSTMLVSCSNNLINQKNIPWIENEIVSESKIVLKEAASNT